MRRFVLLLGILVSFVSLASAETSEEPLKTKLCLDRSTFSEQSINHWQRTADLVAAEVDALIPGRMSEFIRGCVIVYQIHEGQAEAEAFLQAPVTISNDFRLQFEPTAIVGGQTRIALYAVEQPTDYRFVYQLAHELAHIKMGVRFSNYLIETFAVLVSHEILRRLSMGVYIAWNDRDTFAGAPSIYAAFTSHDSSAERKYYSVQSADQTRRLDGRLMQWVGVDLLERLQIPWPKLLGLALMDGLCSLDQHPANFMVCPPDLSRLQSLRPELEALGLQPSSEHQ